MITNSTKKSTLEKAIDTILILLMLFFISLFFRWDLLSVFSKYLLILIILFNLIWVIIKEKYLISIEKYYLRYLRYVLLLTFVLLDILVIFGCFISQYDNAADFSSPLRHGNYYVVQGGRPPILNLHHYKNNVKDKYSVDLVKLNKFGFSIKKYPVNKATDFNIYNDTIYSPCGGMVTDIRQEIDCNFKLIKPVFNDNGRRINNIIVIQYNDFDVILAHIKKGSIHLDIGQTISQNDYVGLVSNAGAIEPHLHIQVLKNGKSVPFKVDGKFLHNNSILRYNN